ncbi:sulfite exporter TauE/SafE family protein [Algoriphagus namhaensis]|uniref:Sulfite exporter TauE/SafE family protein n=1 Tax=Algoriphagus namhaensis TaxID=915353 RepID=A0ABV8AYA3_9BACT
MLWTAVVLGFLGSFHCIGMCGPIAMAVGGSSNQTFIAKKILYNFGRAITYAGLGLLVGGLGFSLSLAGVQQGVSIGMGVLIVVFSLSYKKADKYLTVPALSSLVAWVKGNLGNQLKAGSAQAFLFTGLLNGLLPCGMVYMALVAALGLQSPWMGATYMFFFGMGTIPMLLVLMFSGNLLSVTMRMKFQRAIPYVGLVIGVLFIFRGLGLGIQGSPKLIHDYGSEKIEITMCN